MTTPGPPTLPQLITGYWVSQAIYAAARFDFPRHLGAGPCTAAELAAVAGTHPEATYRLLRALSSIGIFRQDEDGRFALTPMAEQLGDPAMRSFSLMTGKAMFKAWGALHHSVQSAVPAFDSVFGMPVFQYLRENPEEAAIFDAAMTGVHGPETVPMIDAYDFAAFTSVVDVGGGNGSVLAAILARNPGVHGVLFDLPDVTDRAAELFRHEGIADRCKVVGGSFFESVPGVETGATAYVLRHIVHDWSDEQATAILAQCRRAMTADPGNRVLVVESVLQPGDDPDFAKWLDLMMLVIGGKERTEAQYRDLLAAADLELVRIVPTASAVSIVEARAAS